MSRPLNGSGGPTKDPAATLCAVLIVVLGIFSDPSFSHELSAKLIARKNRNKQSVNKLVFIEFRSPCKEWPLIMRPQPGVESPVQGMALTMNAAWSAFIFFNPSIGRYTIWPES